VSKKLVKISVRVEEIIYPRATDEGGWYVIVTDKGKCTGNVSWRPESGERLILEGEWGAYRGMRTFKFLGAMVDIPSDPHAKLVYVCERANGTGVAMQKLIWETWKERWEQDYCADRIPRFSGRMLENFADTLESINEDAQKAATVAWLLSKGATIALAGAAWDEWEENTVGIIQHNCFRLADLPNFGFNNVDKDIRKEFGIENGDPRRLNAGILYALKLLTGSGSTLIKWTDLLLSAIKLLGPQFEKPIVAQVKELFGTGDLRGFKASRSMALSDHFYAERDIWDFANGRPIEPKKEESA